MSNVVQVRDSAEWFPYRIGNRWGKTQFDIDSEMARLYRKANKHIELLFYPEEYPFVEIP